VINPWTHRRILEKGTPGRATIVAASVPARGASMFNMAMTLQVFVEGRTPYEVEGQWMVKASDTEALHGSIPVKVDPDESDKVAIDWDALRAEHEVATEQRRAALAAQGPVEDLADVGESAAAVSPVVDARGDPELKAKLEAILGYELTPGSTIAVAENDPALQMQILQVVAEHQASRAAARPDATDNDDDGDDDLVGRLERLTTLHESGALTDEEFAEAKRHLLDDEAAGR
jgi:hypothetical protein